MASDKSNLSGLYVGCIDLTDAFHTLTVHEHEEGPLAFQVDCVWYTCRVIPFGLASSPLLWERVSAVLSRVGQSLFQPEELRVQTIVDDPGYVSQGPPLRRRVLPILLLLLRVSHGREPVLEPVYRLDWHYDHRPPTPRLQCSVNRNHQHKAAERLALTARLSLRTGLVDVKKFHMSLESSAKPAVSSRGSRL